MTKNTPHSFLLHPHAHTLIISSQTLSNRVETSSTCLAMSQEHLRELLKEDQEPFLLKTHISEKLNQLKNPYYSSLQLKKKHPTHQPSNFSINLCKNACFSSFQTTPESELFRKSPILELTSPVKKSPLRINIPARTASLLLEAALRIQKPKPKKTNTFGVLGSLFKKLKQRRKREIEYGEDSVAEVGLTCSSSAVWSESNEDKSSSSGNSCDCHVEEIEFVKNKEQERTECVFFDDYGFFSESPFRFVLQRSPSYSSARRTEDEESNEINEEEEEEEEKEQFSPVSVLDQPFEDDDDVHENDDVEGDFDDLDYSTYANVQRTKKQLLDKLRRFEKLAELDPLELSKIMQDEEDKDSETFIEEETSYEGKAMREIIFEILYHSNFHDKWQAQNLKRLVYDLIKEEERDLNSLEDRNLVITRVLRRLELWNEVESNTIDMMIEDDSSREGNTWKKNSEQRRELAEEIELAIFCFLVEEFSEELVC